MFRRTDIDLPEDVYFDSDLQELGYSINERSQFVKTTDPTQFFEFLDSDDVRHNDVRQEAMHECVRAAVLFELAGLGIKPLYLSGNQAGSEGTVISESRPDGPHVKILTSDIDELKSKKDVIVLVGEHNQDLGIWSYRLLMREGGMEHGAAVGLIKELGYVVKPQSFPQEDATDPQVLEKALNALQLYGGDRKDSKNDDEGTSSNVPGVVILNPGELLYSPAENHSLSINTWQAKHKPNALASEFSVDPTYNVIPGHKNAIEHVKTFFESVYHQLTSRDSRLYIAAIGDGADNVVEWLDETLHLNQQAPVGGELTAIDMIQPTYRHENLMSETFKKSLAFLGRSWIMDDKPKGVLLTMPHVLDPIVTYDDEIDHAGDSQLIASTQDAFEGQTIATSTNNQLALPEGDMRNTQPSQTSMIFAMSDIDAKQDAKELVAYEKAFKEQPPRARLRPRDGSNAADAKRRGDVNFLRKPAVWVLDGDTKTIAEGDSSPDLVEGFPVAVKKKSKPRPKKVARAISIDKATGLDSLQLNRLRVGKNDVVEEAGEEADDEDGLSGSDGSAGDGQKEAARKAIEGMIAQADPEKEALVKQLATAQQEALQDDLVSPTTTRAIQSLDQAIAEHIETSPDRKAAKVNEQQRHSTTHDCPTSPLSPHTNALPSNLPFTTHSSALQISTTWPGLHNCSADLPTTTTTTAGAPIPDLTALLSPNTASIPYDYDAANPVSCATYSAGPVGLVELIWPEVLDDVLEHFEAQAKFANAEEARQKTEVGGIEGAVAEGSVEGGTADSGVMGDVE